MTTTKKQFNITKARLREIIVEELQALHEEAVVDYEGVKTVVNGASKLLKALDAFKDNATVEMVNSLEPEFGSINSRLTDMVNNPMSYIDKPKPEPKVVKLRQVKDDD